MVTNAIETEYAGHRFRSRLEARWAVFFDHLGIKWLYEPQGYVLGNGQRYLPDFWLPQFQVWAEVKGAATVDDMATLQYAAAADGLPLIYERGDPPNVALDDRSIRALPYPLERVLILGDIPTPPPSGEAWVHPLITLTGTGTPIQGVFIGDTEGLFWIGRPQPWPTDLPAWLHGLPARCTVQPGSVLDAYGAARKARFEHGESGYDKPALKQLAERLNTK